MPSPPEPLLEERYDRLLEELRAARPYASSELRERVRALTVEPEPVRRPTRVTRRPRALVPAFLVALLVGAAGVGVLVRDGGRESQDATFAERQPLQGLLDKSAQDSATAVPRGATPQGAQEAQARAALPPSRTRLQDYRAELRLRVPDLRRLSSATARAMRATRSLGGYVVSADLGAPTGGDGDSILVVRVPVGRVQEALVRFTALGTIVSQRIQIDDRQRTVERQSETIADLEGTVATLERALRDPSLTRFARGRLQLRLADARRSLAERRNARGATVQGARTARIALTLTTRAAGEALVTEPEQAAYLERTLRDAVSVLGRLVAWLLYALIVAAPFLLLGAAALELERRRRRRSEQRLLERA